MGKIQFNIGQGGLGRPLAGKDYYSALLFDNDTYPSGMSASENIKLLGSLQDAENLGILNDGTGETVATGGAIEVTAVGAAGDIINVNIKSTHMAEAIELCEVIQGAGEDTTSLAARIAAGINARTNEHGFTATSALAVVTIIMAPNWGQAFNTAGLSCDITGTATATVTQFDSGVGSPLSLMHYHISEFFRIQPKGALWFGIFDESGGLDNTHIEDIVNFADGEIRQMAIFLQTSWQTSDMGLIQSAITTLQSQYKWLNALYAADQLGDTLSTLTDLRALAYDRVSAVIGQDGGLEGWRMLDVMGISISCIGTALGAVAKASVHENIGWVNKFNLSGGEMDKLSFTTGDLYKAIAENTLTVLGNRAYIFAEKNIGKGGSYFNDSGTAVAITSDYAYIENGRAIDKAMRGINVNLTAFKNAPLYVDADTGQLTELTISVFRNAASITPEQMEIDGELSGYEIIINPAQNVLATSQVEITAKLVPVGVAREIIVNIGYTVSLQS